MNNGFVFAAKNAICTEANYSCPCFATKGTCKASLSLLMEVFLTKCVEVPESCSAHLDEMCEMASTIKTEVLAELNATSKRLHRLALCRLQHFDESG